MSRSFRKRPFFAICGYSSAKQDKRWANRQVRRTHKQAIHNCTDFEEFLLPDVYECPWNDIYMWGRDGKQLWRGWSAREVEFYGSEAAYLEKLREKMRK